MLKYHPYLWFKPPVMLCYLVAALSVTAGLIIARWLAIYLRTSRRVSLFRCAIMLGRLVWWNRAGLLATPLTVLAFAYDFVLPISSFAVEDKEIPRFLIFVLSALYFVPPTFPRSHSC